jgi:hypothetical protein
MLFQKYGAPEATERNNLMFGRLMDLVGLDNTAGLAEQMNSDQKLSDSEVKKKEVVIVSKQNTSRGNLLTAIRAGKLLKKYSSDSTSKVLQQVKIAPKRTSTDIFFEARSGIIRRFAAAVAVDMELKIGSYIHSVPRPSEMVHLRSWKKNPANVQQISTEKCKRWINLITGKKLSPSTVTAIGD